MSRKTIDICNELLAVNARLKSERNEAELREYRVLGRAGAAEESFKQQHRINVDLIEQLEAADNALRSVEAALKGVPYKGIYANGVEWLKARVAFLETVTAPDSLLDVGAICDQRDQLAAQNVALRSALHKLACLGNGDSFGNSVGNCIAQDALNLPNLAESILKRRDATVESKLLRGLVSGANGGEDGWVTCKDLLDMAAEIEKETDR